MTTAEEDIIRAECEEWAGGLLYIVGAAVYALRRPNPSPRVFGYHEIFHALVVAASACHYVAISYVVRALDAA